MLRENINLQLSKYILLFTGLTRRQHRTADYHRFVALREQRKQSRRMYWKPLIGIELATILSIVWYLKMELFHTKKLPSYATPSQLDKLPAFQQEISNRATVVYNTVYRNVQHGQFVLADTGNDELDGRIGFVDWYDSVNVGYRAVVCPRGCSDQRNGRHMLVRPENMEHMTKIRESQYNQEATQDVCHIGLQNTLPQLDADTIEVVFRHTVFQRICAKYNKPQSQADESYELMVRLLDDIEQNEAKEREKVEKDRIEYEKVMEHFFSTHNPVERRPRKRARRHVPNSNPSRAIQINSVWKAKIEHMRNTTNRNEPNDRSETLFNFPFLTNDNSLLSCSENMNELNEHHVNGIRHDNIFSRRGDTDQIIITTESLRSLSPGIDIDEDVLNFCLKWYVSEFFSLHIIHI